MIARSVRPAKGTPSVKEAQRNAVASALSIAALPAPPLERRVPSISNRQTCIKPLYRASKRRDLPAKQERQEMPNLMKIRASLGRIPMYLAESAKGRAPAGLPKAGGEP